MRQKTRREFRKDVSIVGGVDWMVRTAGMVYYGSGFVIRLWHEDKD